MSLQEIQVKVFFVFEMVVDHGLGEVRSSGDFPHGSTVVALFREYPYGSLNDFIF